MALKIKYKRLKDVKLLYVILFILVFSSRITTIYFFSKINVFGEVVNIMQIFMYGGLIYIVAKKKYSLKELFLFSIVGGVLLLGYIVSGQAAYFRGFLLVIASKDVPYRKILNVCRKAMTIVFEIGVVLYLAGISDAGISRRGASGLGFGHPNVAAQLMMIIILLWAAEKAGTMKSIHYIGIELGGALTFLLTGSRTSTIVICLTPFIMCYGEKVMQYAQRGKIFKTLMTYSQLIIMMFTYFAVIFIERSSLLMKLDLIFASRLFLNYYVFNRFGVKMFGQNVILQDNSGTVYNNIHGWYNWSVTCDCSYMVTLLVMGLIPTIVVMIGYIMLMKKAIKRNNYMVVSLALLLAIYSFCESQMLEIYSSFVYFYLMTNDEVLDNISVNQNLIKLSKNGGMNT